MKVNPQNCHLKSKTIRLYFPNQFDLRVQTWIACAQIPLLNWLWKWSSYLEWFLHLSAVGFYRGVSSQKLLVVKNTPVVWCHCSQCCHWSHSVAIELYSACGSYCNHMRPVTSKPLEYIKFWPLAIFGLIPLYILPHLRTMHSRYELHFHIQVSTGICAHAI